MGISKIGILGACGSTGQIIARELIAEKDAVLLIGGRDQGKIEKFAGELGKGAKALRVDIDNPQELDAFCREPDILINCAGPSIVYSEKVALTALKNNCHYLDPGGYGKLDQALADYQEEINKKGLYFVHSCGWIPGISEVFARFSHTIALQKMDSLENFEHIYGDRNEWSENGLRDIIWHMQQTGKEVPADPGENTSQPTKLAEREAAAPTKVPFIQEFILPAPFGKQKVYYSFPKVLRSLGNEYQQMSSYMMLVSLRTIFTRLIIQLFYRNNEKKAIRALQKAFAKDCRKNFRGGGVVDQIQGSRSGQKQFLVGSFIESRSYWLTAIASVIAAKMILQGQMKAAGCNHLCNAVDVVIFMNLLAKAGLKYEFTLNGAKHQMEV